MIIESIPSDYYDAHQQLIVEGLQILGVEEIPKTKTGRLSLLAKFDSILSDVPCPVGQVDSELIKGRFLSAVGIVYGLIVAEEISWEMCWLRDEGDDIDDGVDSVVSPDRAYFFTPIAVVSKEAYQHGKETVKVYEKIISRDFPDMPPGSFYEIQL